MMARPENVVIHGQHLMYWRPSLRIFPQLIDARDAQHDLPASDIRRLFELVSHLRAAHGFSHRTALVVSTLADFGMVRM